MHRGRGYFYYGPYYRNPYYWGGPYWNSPYVGGYFDAWGYWHPY
jgi:hypothetical protein